GPDLLNLVKKSHYGLSSSNVAVTYLSFLPISLVVSLALVNLPIGLSGQMNLEFVIGFLVTSQLWILTSSLYHPCLHMTEAELVEKLHPFWRFFMFSRLSRFIARSHRTHHSAAGEVNQNLNLGFDFFYAWVPVQMTDLIDLIHKKALY